MTAMMVGGGAFGGSMGGGVGRGGLSPPTPPSPHPLKLPSPRSPPSPTSSDSPTSPASPGRSQGNKACGVCGDVAKSMHFGGLSCDSCKAFFRRSVQNNAYKGFTCPYEKKCVIAVSSRKACQYCRFNKCIAIGMEKGWVMSEDERRKMMQQRQEKKQKEELKRQTEIQELDKYSLPEEAQTEISIIVSLYKKAYQDIPYEESCQQDGPTGVMVPWMTFYKRIAYFFSLFREFTELPSSDQALLLKTAITSAGIIMGSVVYDSSTGRWPGKGISRTGLIPQKVTTQNVERLVPADLMNRVSQFFRKFQQVCPDETMGMILILVALYSPELMGLEAKDTIQHLQDRYTSVLHSYVKWKYKEKSALMFPKVIVSLADIRELAELTSQIRIQQGMASNIPNLSTLLSKPGSQPSSSASSPMETNQEEASTSRQTIPNIEIKEEISDYGELPQTPTVHKRVRLEATGGKRDHINQKIMQKVMEQMQGSSLHLLVPHLPHILQIVKRVGSGSNVDMSLPTISQATSTNKSSQHQAKRRCGPKRRLVEVKQEKIDEDFDTSDMPVVTSPIVDSPVPMNIAPNPVTNHHNLFNQSHQLPHSNFSIPHLQDLQPPHQTRCVPSPGLSPGLAYPASPMESTDSCDMLPPSPLHLSNSQMSPLPAASHHMPHQSSDMLMPTQVPHMAPVAPYTPPSSVATSPMPVQQPGIVPVSDMPLPSPMAAPSPFADTSSSSPESSQSPLTEIFTEELTDVEIDVLTQILEYITTIDNLDNVSNLKSLPSAELIDELQRKLCSYSMKPE
ncbi:hypothetical protein SK128_024782 [Halocaridina rubra]|uniref:Uncharacterized protein n=1 Tax=Halocaridina rubra TaxID=373956 RepID=A0AAN8ZST4_HALRR